MSAPKKILHVIDSLDLGGAQTFLLELVKHLDRKRYLPEVASMHGQGVYARAFEQAGIKTHSLSPSKIPPFYLPNFWRLMRRENYDILHFHLFGSNLCAKPLAIAAGHPAIIVHDQCNDASRDANPLLLAADAFWNRQSSRVIAVSESVRRYLIDREDLPEARIEMIPNGINAEMFFPAADQQKDDARHRLGLPLGAYIVGGVGRLVVQKNFTAFLEVARQVLVSHPDTIFVIAGTGPQDANLRGKVSSLGINESVRFLGHVEARTALYHAVDALLMTSDFEGTPMTLLEAMASCLPVVASRVDGIAEVCTHLGDALLVSPSDVTGYARALETVIGDPETGMRLGKTARETVLKKYEIRDLTRRIESVYEGVLCD